MSFRECFPERTMVPNEVVRRELTHEELERQVQEYLARGGKIERVESQFRAKPQDDVRDFFINAKREAERIKKGQRPSATHEPGKRAPGASGVRGIHKLKNGKWRATHKGQHIGQYSELDDAIAAQNWHIKQQVKK